MSTITAILEPDVDGSLHLPVPKELRAGRVRVTAVLEPVATPRPMASPRFGCLAGKIKVEPGFDEPVADFKDYME